MRRARLTRCPRLPCLCRATLLCTPCLWTSAWRPACRLWGSAGRGRGHTARVGRAPPSSRRTRSSSSSAVPAGGSGPAARPPPAIRAAGSRPIVAACGTPYSLAPSFMRRLLAELSTGHKLFCPLLSSRTRTLLLPSNPLSFCPALPFLVNAKPALGGSPPAPSENQRSRATAAALDPSTVCTLSGVHHLPLAFCSPHLNSLLPILFQPLQTSAADTCCLRLPNSFWCMRDADFAPSVAFGPSANSTAVTARHAGWGGGVGGREWLGSVGGQREAGVGWVGLLGMLLAALPSTCCPPPPFVRLRYLYAPHYCIALCRCPVSCVFSSVSVGTRDISRADSARPLKPALR